MIKLLVLSLLLLIKLEALAADPLCKSTLGFYSDDAQDCNRCFFQGGKVNSDCYTEKAKFPRYATTTILKKKLVDSEANLYQYTIQYSRCSWSLAGKLNSDDCDKTYSSEPIIVDDKEIVDKPEDCLLPGKTINVTKTNSLNDYSQTDLGGKICLSKVSPDKKSFLSNSNLYKKSANNNNLICLFFIENNKPVGRACIIDNIIPPPPFTLGILPKKTFQVPTVTDPKALTDLTFARPGGQIEIMAGEDLEKLLVLQIDLLASKNLTTKTYEGLIFGAKIIQEKPDLISLGIIRDQEEMDEIGSFPRPALEERPDKVLGSFFPCYATYTNQFNEKFQAIELFNINANLGDIIGPELYLGPNYLPSTSPDKIGNLMETGCDLCINAKNDDPLYKDGYKLSNERKIKSCQLKENIKIKPVNLVNKDQSKITYFYKEGDKTRKEILAPLRLDSFSKLELKNLSKIQEIGYKVDSAWIENLFVEIKPVIPDFKQGDPDFIRAIVTQREPLCNIYRLDDIAGKGLLFLKAAGKRERSFCNSQEGYPDKIFTLCGENKDKVTKAICHGQYKGKDTSESDQIVPDKLCITSNSRWDFIKGGYSWGEKTTSSFIPGVACTFLPVCKNNLGPKPVPNLGFAIWDDQKNYAFNSKGEGICQEVAALKSQEQIYTYQYDLEKYDISDQVSLDEKSKATLIKELKDIIAAKKGQSFLTIQDLEGTSLIKAYNENSDILLTCFKKKPKATCIGGIYGDLDEGTNCVSLTKNDKLPIQCQEKTE